jgi:hypothetical protein
MNKNGFFFFFAYGTYLALNRTLPERPETCSTDYQSGTPLTICRGNRLQI